MKRLLVVLAVLALAGCAPPSNGYRDDGTTLDENVSKTMLVDSFALSIYRVIDGDTGVVCWIYSGYEQGGIDCMPLAETELEP